MMSIREYARRRGVTHRAVQQAIEAGRIDVRREQRGKKQVYFIDPVTADKQWDERSDHTFKRSKTKGEKAAQPGQPVQPVGPTTSSTLYGQAKTARETYAAKMAELQYRERAGELVSADGVKTLFFEIAKTVQTNMLNIPDRVSSLIAAEGNEKVVHDILTHEIRVSLQRLADGNLTI
jgi:hypothetical protein